MNTTVRRICWLALFGGAGYAGWLAWQSRSDQTSDDATWPPLDAEDAGAAADTSEPADALATDSEQIAAAVPTADDARWVEPVDGDCPDGFPVKANDNSGIYHVPGGRFYERTVPERCYADTDAAEADGYRAAKA
ncbi:MAG: hypothetical protein HKN41_06795 [Ilumatobacter sp.]|nr:hypothetical protein [Ilumatobacter sp.]